VFRFKGGLGLKVFSFQFSVFGIQFLFLLTLLILKAFVLHYFVVDCVDLGVCGISPAEVLPWREV
jgi:hypothetical protein